MLESEVFVFRSVHMRTRGQEEEVTFRLLRCTPSLFLYFSIGKYSASRRDMI